MERGAFIMSKEQTYRKHTGEFKQQVIEDMRGNELSYNETDPRRAGKNAVSRKSQPMSRTHKTVVRNQAK
jgi:hypothetical protein